MLTYRPKTPDIVRRAQAAPTSGASEPSVAEQRMALCRACDHARALPGGVVQCKQCGCVMNAKTKLRGAKCPISKW